MKKTIIAAAVVMLSGCAGVKDRGMGSGICPPGCSPAKPTAETGGVVSVPDAYAPVFADLDDKKSLLKAAGLNLQYLRSTGAPSAVYSFGSRKVTTADLAAATAEFIKIISEAGGQDELDRRIKEKFEIYRLAGQDSTGTVVFSSYYEPTLRASLKPGGEYVYPIYARPDDLVTVNLGNFNEKFKGEKISGRLDGKELAPYIDREAIDFEGALKGRGLELAWFRDRVDVMDLHIEGSGRLLLDDGREMKAKFAATNSLKFKGWLSALVEIGALPREGISEEKGRAYLRDHPEKVRDVMTRNRRYTFFRLEDIKDPEAGPEGTYGLPLVGWRSIAIDNALVPMGALAFMSVTTPDVNDRGELLGRKQDRRFVFCQDTGGAIKGPARVDFFAGNGEKAHTFAFKLWDPGTLHLLLLKERPAESAGKAP